MNFREMNARDAMAPLDWVNRVNRSWIVRHGLAERAEEWIAYLGELEDGRLEASCETARCMTRLRERSEDPKPWFYAGLFSRATAAEVSRFLSNHRLTPASIPSMWEDEGVKLWISQIRPETRQLLERLRQGITDCGAFRG